MSIQFTFPMNMLMCAWAALPHPFHLALPLLSHVHAIAVQRCYKLHSTLFSAAILRGSLLKCQSKKN